MFFSENIRKARTVWEYNQQEMADLLGVSQNSISKYERGESDPNLDNAIAFSNALGISVQEIIHTRLDFEQIPAKPLKPDEVREPETKPATYQKTERIGDLSNFTVLVQTVRDLQIRVDKLVPMMGDADGIDKLKVLEALLTITKYLESGMDEADFAEEKKLFLEKLRESLLFRE